MAAEATDGCPPVIVQGQGESKQTKVLHGSQATEAPPHHMRYWVFASVVWRTSLVYSTFAWHENTTLEIVHFLETSSHSHLRFLDLNQPPYPSWNNLRNYWCSPQTSCFSRIPLFFLLPYFPHVNRLGKEIIINTFTQHNRISRIFSPSDRWFLRKTKTCSCHSRGSFNLFWIGTD